MPNGARAAILAATMNLIPVAQIDIARFLRVPAIVLTLRRVQHRRHCTARCQRRSLR